MKELARARTKALRARRARILGLNYDDDDDDNLDCWYGDGGLNAAITSAETKAEWGLGGDDSIYYSNRSRSAAAARRLLLASLVG